jgi:hypothetical protein
MGIFLWPLLRALRDTCAVFGALVLVNTAIPLGVVVDTKVAVAAFVVLAIYEYITNRHVVAD